MIQKNLVRLTVATVMFLVSVGHTLGATSIEYKIQDIIYEVSVSDPMPVDDYRVQAFITASLSGPGRLLEVSGIATGSGRSNTRGE